MLVFLKRVALVLFSPVLIVLSPLWLPVLALGLITETLFLPSEVMFLLRMHRRGRVLTARAWRICGAACSGTLIVETHTIGWSMSRLWWTADDIFESYPYTELTEVDLLRDDTTREWHRFHEWCASEYLDEKCGRARLVRVWNGREHANRICGNYPFVRVLECFSASEEYLRLIRGEPHPFNE